MYPIHFYSVKGGVGTTTTALQWMLARPQQHYDFYEMRTDHLELRDGQGILGCADDTETVANIHFKEVGERIVHQPVFDWGVLWPDIDRLDLSAVGVRLLVVDNSYVTLRRLARIQSQPKWPTPDVVLIMTDPSRALKEADVRHVVTVNPSPNGQDLVLSLPYLPSIQRAVDAGLLATRADVAFADAMEKLLDD